MKTFDAAEVAKHRTAESCWVVLYGHVYDVTNFLPSHPGGANVILQLAGTDATEEYDPIHPPGTLEENLPPEAKLGTVDPSTLAKQAPPTPKRPADDATVDLKALLNLDEIEDVATKKISHKTWGYYYSAADDLYSKRLNNLAYRSILLRPRVFMDCTTCSTNTGFLGHPVQTPIYVSPAALARLAHPSGEHGIATACKRFGCAMVISNNASQTPEQIVEGAGPDQVFGWQLYVQNDRSKSEAMLERISRLPQIKFVALTLDAPVPGKREDDIRSKAVGANDSIKAAVQVEDASKKSTDGPPPGGGLTAGLFWGTAADLTWRTTLPWLVKATNLPIIIKGVMTHEDAWVATQYPQVRGIVLSNHGGRTIDTAPPAVHTLLEIRKYCPSVFSQLEVYVDGGIRRGTDVVKALCLGAKGVGIGRAPLFGLGAGGIAGVERTLEILQDEMVAAMKMLGAQTLEELGMHHVNTRIVDREIYDGPPGLTLEKVRAKL